MSMDPAEVLYAAKLQAMLQAIFDPVAGCWGEYGCETDFAFDELLEAYTLEVWPNGVPVVEGQVNGHHAVANNLMYEFATFDFLPLLQAVPVTGFTFDQQDETFEIEWEEGEDTLNLRIHLLPRAPS